MSYSNHPDARYVTTQAFSLCHNWPWSMSRSTFFECLPWLNLIRKQTLPQLAAMLASVPTSLPGLRSTPLQQEVMVDIEWSCDSKTACCTYVCRSGTTLLTLQFLAVQLPSHVTDTSHFFIIGACHQAEISSHQQQQPWPKPNRPQHLPAVKSP